MKFKIYSTSGYMEKYPDWGKLQEKYPMQKKRRIFVDLKTFLFVVNF